MQRLRCVVGPCEQVVVADQPEQLPSEAGVQTARPLDEDRQDIAKGFGQFFGQPTRLLTVDPPGSWPQTIDVLGRAKRVFEGIGHLAPP